MGVIVRILVVSTALGCMLVSSASSRPLAPAGVDGARLSGGQILRDYGDAPEGLTTGYGPLGRFPSLSASDGARAADTGYAFLGKDVTTERDSRQGGDARDDGVFLIRVVPCQRVDLRLLVTLPTAGEPDRGTGYVNVFVDWDRNGRWQGVDRTCGPRRPAPEWALQNRRIDLSAQAGREEIYPVRFRAGRYSGPVWIRVVLSVDEPLTTSSGAGAFARGEVEDYLVGDRRTDGYICIGDFVVHGTTGEFGLWGPPEAPPLVSARLHPAEKQFTPQRDIRPLGRTTRSAGFEYASKQVHALGPAFPFVFDQIRLRYAVREDGRTIFRSITCDVVVAHDRVPTTPVGPGGPPGGSGEPGGSPQEPVTPPPAPPPPPPPKPTSQRTSVLTLNGCVPNVNIAITHRINFYIPVDALSPTHGIFVPGTSDPVARPICPATTETETFEFFPPGVTPPGGRPPTAGERAYQVTIVATGGPVARGPASTFEAEVRWTNP